MPFARKGAKVEKPKNQQLQISFLYLRNTRENFKKGVIRVIGVFLIDNTPAFRLYLSALRVCKDFTE